MKRQRHLQKISAGISLVILSLGFSFLGLLSFFDKRHADLANVPCVDSAYRIAGSAASLLAGTKFVVASCVFPAIANTGNAQNGWTMLVTCIGDGTLDGRPELNRSGFRQSRSRKNIGCQRRLTKSVFAAPPGIFIISWRETS